MFALPVVSNLAFFEDLDEYEEDTYVGTESIYQLWESFMDQYGLPVLRNCVSYIYTIYTHFTLFNLTIFILKYTPMGIYTYKVLKNIYITSSERIKQKRMELEDIQLQVQILETKMCVRDAELSERAEQVRRGAERLRRVRARVRHLLAGDEALRRALHAADSCDMEQDAPAPAPSSASEHGSESITELLKEMKYDQITLFERAADKGEGGGGGGGGGGERAHTDPDTPDDSVYSSLSDVDVKKDCRVKIFKVTNVYKVAYLKHYIKQKKLRKATKQALLKKKMDSIKKLLEDWQKTLNMVINYSKVTMLDHSCHSGCAHSMDVASQEAMGDYSKRNLRDSDSDSDAKTNNEPFYDECSLNWIQGPNRKYAYNFEDITETAVARECFECQEFNEACYPPPQCECNGPKGGNVLFLLPEETRSQLAIEARSDAGDDCDHSHDLISL